MRRRGQEALKKGEARELKNMRALVNSGSMNAESEPRRDSCGMKRGGVTVFTNEPGAAGSVSQNDFGQAPNSLTWDDILPLMAELKHMARRLLAGEGNRRGIQTTALVNSALLRQKKKNQRWSEVRWEDRNHFFGQVHRAMWQTLIDHARRGARCPVKGAGNLASEALAQLVKAGILRTEDLATPIAGPGSALVNAEFIKALDELRKSGRNAKHQLAEIVEYRYIEGLTFPEIGELLGLHGETVRSRFNLAIAILRKASMKSRLSRSG